MSRILLYMALLTSVAVAAQLALFNAEETAQGGARPAAGQAADTDGASGEGEVDDLEAQPESEPAEMPGDDNTGTGDTPGPEAGAESADGDDSGAGTDFEPTEEISEDYPVPLPSDI